MLLVCAGCVLLNPHGDEGSIKCVGGGCTLLLVAVCILRGVLDFVGLKVSCTQRFPSGEDCSSSCSNRGASCYWVRRSRLVALPVVRLSS